MSASTPDAGSIRVNKSKTFGEINEIATHVETVETSTVRVKCSIVKIDKLFRNGVDISHSGSGESVTDLELNLTPISL